jgi:allantoate deiminase
MAAVTTPTTTLAVQVVARCRALAEISREHGVLTRPYASPAMTRANALVGVWMQEAGLSIRMDAAGNLVGRLDGSDPSAGTLLLGSHLDTVADAGAFDGPLGVMVAIAALARLRDESVELPFAIDVLGFADEEGLRFGTAYLGSRALAGTFDDELLELKDEDGISLRDALAAFGGDPYRIAGASRRDERLLGYCEVHMEQGPVLDDLGVPVGVVSAIAGATRAEVRFDGHPGHAGTIPMDVRRDAACAAAELVLAAEATAHATGGLLATVGRLLALPGAPNVVPGAAIASIDVRHADDAVRRQAVDELRAEAEAIAARRRLRVEWQPRLDNPAVDVDPLLTAQLEASVAGLGHDVHRMPSGAGHDGVALAELTGIAMLFVRCAGGLSHHPDESVAEADVAVALDVLDGFLRRLAVSAAA